MSRYVSIKRGGAESRMYGRKEREGRRVNERMRKRACMERVIRWVWRRRAELRVARVLAAF